MPYNISAFAGAGAQFFDNNGTPLVGGLLYVYTAGTTTPATTWTTNSGAVANTNPIVMDAGGRTPYEIWVNGGVNYKFVLKTSAGVTIGTYDNVPAIDDPSVFNNLITVTGTDALLGTSTPPYTAYVAGMTLSFVPVNVNTGAVTIDVDGLGAKEITVGTSSPLSGGELVVGQIANIEYDGTRFQLAKAVIADGTVTTNKLADGAVTSAKLTTNQLTLTNAINTAPPVSLASASSVAIGAAASNNLTITGTTTITAFDTIAAGATRQLTFSGVLVLTHNATSLILPGAANITTAAGDTAQVVSLGSGNWRCVVYTKADGTSVANLVDTQTFNSTGTWTKPSSGQTMCKIQLWGGGGGGGKFATLAQTTAGGGGGAYNEIIVPLSYLAASLTASVGAGGAGATSTTGGVGGTSSVPFASTYGGMSSVVAYGGGGGTGNNGSSNGGGGAGATAAGATGTGGAYGGGAAGAIPTDIWGGAGGGLFSGSAVVGANAIFGGAGGGGWNTTSFAAGTSLYAGNGGAANTAGVQPSGGGGGGVSGGNGAAGGAGRVIITSW